MHGDLTLGGPVYWLLVGLAALVAVGALAMLIDASRRPRGDFGALGRWGYVALAALFLGMSVIGQFVKVPALGLLVFAGLFFATFVTEFIYLLRVVFPSPARLASRNVVTDEEPDREPGTNL